MMNLDHVVENFCNQDNTLGERVRKAVELRSMAQSGDISSSELEELLEDLKSLEGIELNAAELDQQIAFNECFEALCKLPI